MLKVIQNLKTHNFLLSKAAFCIDPLFLWEMPSGLNSPGPCGSSRWAPDGPRGLLSRFLWTSSTLSSPGKGTCRSPGCSVSRKPAQHSPPSLSLWGSSSCRTNLGLGSPFHNLSHLLDFSRGKKKGVWILNPALSTDFTADRHPLLYRSMTRVVNPPTSSCTQWALSLVTELISLDAFVCFIYILNLPVQVLHYKLHRTRILSVQLHLKSDWFRSKEEP